MPTPAHKQLKKKRPRFVGTEGQTLLGGKKKRNKREQWKKTALGEEGCDIQK